MRIEEFSVESKNSFDLALVTAHSREIKATLLLFLDFTELKHSRRSPFFLELDLIRSIKICWVCFHSHFTFCGEKRRLYIRDANRRRERRQGN